ncbi:MAG: hypothetical protein QM686_05910, partial [Herbaspirillum sp.]
QQQAGKQVLGNVLGVHDGFLFRERGCARQPVPVVVDQSSRAVILVPSLGKHGTGKKVKNRNSLFRKILTIRFLQRSPRGHIPD